MNWEEMELHWKWSEWRSSDTVALHWLIGSQVAFFTMECYPLALHWSEWHSSGSIRSDWLMSGFGIHLKTWLIGRFPIYREATDWPRLEMKLFYRDTPLAVNWHICYWLVISNLGQSQKSDRNRGSWLVESSECCLLIGREVHQKIFKGITLMIQKLCQWNIFELKWHWIGSMRSDWIMPGFGIHLKTWLIGRFPIYREATD